MAKVSSKANSLFKQAHKAHTSGKLEEAIQTYKKLLTLEDSPGTWSNLGVAYRSAGHLEKALDILQTGILKHPDFLDLHYNLGNAFRAENRPKKSS